MPDPTERDGELIRLRNRVAALEANGAELLARAEKAEADLEELRNAMVGDRREEIEKIQTERDAMPKDERIRREALDAPLLRIQLACFAGENVRLKGEMERVVQSAADEVWEKAGFNALIHWKGRTEQAEATVERVRDLCHQPYTAAYDLAADILAELPCRPKSATESPAAAPMAVSAATEAHGSAGEAEEGSR